MKLFNSQKLSSGILSLAMIAGISFSAQAEVKVSFSDDMQRYIGRLNAIEIEREKVFREYRTERNVRRRSDAQRERFSERYQGIEWGNERVIEDVDNFSIETLLSGMIEQGVMEADPDFKGAISVEIDRIRLERHPLVRLRALNTYMSGTVTVYDAAGNEILQEYVTSYFTQRSYQTGASYTGRDYAYLSAAKFKRVGPIAAKFNEEILQKLYPSYDARGAILLAR